jgi:hypothetical protein
MLLPDSSYNLPHILTPVHNPVPVRHSLLSDKNEA